MHSEVTERSFIDERERDHQGLRERILETIAYAQQNPEDTWGATSINHLLHEGQHLKELVSSYEALEPELPVVGAMLETGQYNGQQFDLPITDRKAGGWHDAWPHGGSFRGYARAVLERRLAIARLYIADPKLASTFLDLGIIGFHGTGAIELPSILEHGILSHQELNKRSIIPFTGERLNPRGRARFVSFVEWDEFGTAHRYAQHFGRVGLRSITDDAASLPREYSWMAQKAEEQEVLLQKILAGHLSTWQHETLQEPFELIVGLSATIFERRQHVAVESDIKAEFGFVGESIPSANLPLLLVPKDKIAITEQAVTEYSPDPSRSTVANKDTVARSFNRRISLEWLIRDGLTARREAQVI